MPLDEELSEQMRLVDADYDRTSKFVDALVAASSASRGWAITLWVALVGFGFDHRVWTLALVAAVAIAVFAVADSYYAALYKKALERAVNLEATTGKYFTYLALGSADTDMLTNLTTSLKTFAFGPLTHITRVGFSDRLKAIPGIFVWTYIILEGLALASAVFINALPAATAKP
jgi:hypothetical protein